MSIPTPFNPLGTLGDGYVKDGLKLFVDCLASDRAELFDVVAGISIPNAHGKLEKRNDSSIRVSGGKGVVPWPANVARVSEPTLEIVARPVSSAPYGLVVTPFAGDVSDKMKYCTVNNTRFITMNGTGVIVTLSEKLTGVAHVSFFSNKQIWQDGQLREDGEVHTGTFAAAGVPSLLSLNWNAEVQAWDIFAIRYYDRKLNAGEIARNYNIDKKRFGL